MIGAWHLANCSQTLYLIMSGDSDLVRREMANREYSLFIRHHSLACETDVGRTPRHTFQQINADTHLQQATSTKFRIKACLRQTSNRRRASSNAHENCGLWPSCRGTKNIHSGLCCDKGDEFSMIQATASQLLSVHSPRRTHTHTHTIHLPPSAQTIIITRSEAATFDSFVGRPSVCASAAAFFPRKYETFSFD